DSNQHQLRLALAGDSSAFRSRSKAGIHFLAVAQEKGFEEHAGDFFSSAARRPDSNQHQLRLALAGDSSAFRSRSKAGIHFLAVA
ncbi:hypothetical protein C7D72_29395, partial [Klebsiella pneumoniae]